LRRADGARGLRFSPLWQDNHKQALLDSYTSRMPVCAVLAHQSSLIYTSSDSSRAPVVILDENGWSTDTVQMMNDGGVVYC
jgi:hypothetical protein